VLLKPDALRRLTPRVRTVDRIAVQHAAGNGFGVDDKKLAAVWEYRTSPFYTEAERVALFGFLNRWNDTMATPLEEEPIEIGKQYLAAHGWHAGKHRAR